MTHRRFRFFDTAAWIWTIRILTKWVEKMFICTAHAYLNIDDPICAGTTARGVLVSTRTCGSDTGFISVMAAGLIKSGNETRISNELRIENIRQSVAPGCVSRLQGIFCFTDHASSQEVQDWGGHFRDEYFAEGELRADHLTVVDSNWITYAPRDSAGLILNDADYWVDLYWKGHKFPGRNPVWETIAHGRFVVLETDLRKRSFDRVAEEFPKSLGILEIARASAWINSDLGNCSAFLRQVEDHVTCEYIMDFRDAANKDFLENLVSEKAIVNHHLLVEHMKNESFGNMPDMRPHGFKRPRFGASVPRTFDHQNA